MLLASSIPMKNEGVKGFPRCVVTQKIFHTVLMIFFTHLKFSIKILLADSILYQDIDICFFYYI